MINLIVGDLENVLIPEGETQIPEEVLELIAQLKNNNILFAVATGRNYDAVFPLFGKLKNDIVYICNDGGTVIYQDKVISKTPIDRLVCMDVANEIEKDNRFQLIFADEREAFIYSDDSRLKEYLKNRGIEVNKEKEAKAIHKEITKITIFAPDGLDEESYQNFFMKWSKKANVAVSTPVEAYITGEYVSKGTALALLQHLFEISEEDTVVFGGGYSDIDMFEHSYFSYAMQSADAQVKRAAQHIAENIQTIVEDILRMR